MARAKTATIIELPLISDEGVVAEVYDIETGEHVDSTFNFESAITYIQDGQHIAVAVADENERLTVERMNDLFIHERRLFEDCWSKRRVEFAA